jgi:hypothetical protein
LQVAQIRQSCFEATRAAHLHEIWASDDPAKLANGGARLKTAKRRNERRSWARSLFLSVAAIGIVAGAIPTVSHAGGIKVAGQVLDGSTPICNATVTLYEAGSSHYYGAGATACGAATSDGSGNFLIAASCNPPAAAQIYLVATGGALNTGDCASSSPIITLTTALGPYSKVGSKSSYVINELTTVASVWSLAQFLNPADSTDAGAPAANTLGLRNAAATVSNLVDVGVGQLASTLSAVNCASTPPDPNCQGEERLVTLANALAACIEAGVSSSQCNNLFTSATPPNGTPPTNTGQAALDVALNPATVGVVGIFNVAMANTPYSPSLSSAPSDWTISLNFTGGGMDFPFAVEVDGLGNVWVTNSGVQFSGATCGSVTKLSPTGTILSGPNGYTAGGIMTPEFLAIDSNNDVWIDNSGFPFSGDVPSGCPTAPYTAGNYYGSATKLDQSGNPIAGPVLTANAASNRKTFSGGMAIDAANNLWAVGGQSSLVELGSGGNVIGTISGGGLDEPIIPAIDAAGNVWVANCPFCNGVSAFGNVSEFDETGTALSGSQGYAGSGIVAPDGIAVDPRGNVWAADGAGSVNVLNGAGQVVASYSGPDLDRPDNVIIDGGGNAWLSDCGVCCGGSTVGNEVAITPTGARISPPAGFTGSGLINPSGDAIDESGNVWISNGFSALSPPGCNGFQVPGSVTEIIGAAVPAKLPLTDSSPASTSASIPLTLALGNTPVGDAVTKNLTIGNSGHARFFLRTVSSSNPSEFVTGASTCPATGLAPAMTCTIPISFMPSAVGVRGTILTLSDNSAASPQSVTVSGSGVADMTVTPTSAMFTSTKIGSKKTKTITVGNKQNVQVSLTLPPGFSGTNAADFSQTGGTCKSTLAAKTTCTLIVTYAPTQLGTESATMTVTDSPDSQGPYTVSFTTAENIPATVIPASTLAFGTLTAKAPSRTKNITVTNLSAFSLSVSEGSIGGANAGDFAVTGGTCGGGTVSANSSCTIAITFTPTAGPSAESASIAVSVGSDPTSPHTISLTGTGP